MTNVHLATLPPPPRSPPPQTASIFDAWGGVGESMEGAPLTMERSACRPREETQTWPLPAVGAMYVTGGMAFCPTIRPIFILAKSARHGRSCTFEHGKRSVGMLYML